MDYKVLAQQTAQDILGYSQDTSGWKVVKSSKKVTVSSKASKTFHGNIYRVEGIMSESTSKLADFLYKPEIRINWDKSLKAYRHIHMSCHYTKFCHGLNIPRDFVDIVHSKCYEGNVYVISSRSVDFPGYPPSSHYIRGYNHACGFVCSPLKDNPAHSKLVMFVQTEMRGKLSPSIVEATMPSNLVNLILNIKDGIKTHKAPPEHGRHHSCQSHRKKK